MRPSVLLAALCLAFAGPVSAATIGLPNTLVEVVSGFSSASNTPLETKFIFTGDIVEGPPSPLFVLFDLPSVSQADVGRLLLATPLNTPDFAGIQGLLTNHSDLDTFLVQDATGGLGFMENVLFGPGFSLQGFQIDAIALRIDTFGNVRRFGFNERQFSFTLAVTGRPVPEPLEMGLLGLGLGLLGLARRVAGPA